MEIHHGKSLRIPGDADLHRPTLNREFALRRRHEKTLPVLPAPWDAAAWTFFRNFRPQVLRDYALLADGERGALIGPQGDLAWLCCPRWDSDAVFSTLIGGAGCYALTPRAATPGAATTPPAR